jgi:hypothetical protein
MGKLTVAEAEDDDVRGNRKHYMCTSTKRSKVVQLSHEYPFQLLSATENGSRVH